MHPRAVHNRGEIEGFVELESRFSLGAASKSFCSGRRWDPTWRFFFFDDCIRCDLALLGANSRRRLP